MGAVSPNQVRPYCANSKIAVLTIFYFLEKEFNRVISLCYSCMCQTGEFRFIVDLQYIRTFVHLHFHLRLFYTYQVCDSRISG